MFPSKYKVRTRNDIPKIVVQLNIPDHDCVVEVGVFRAEFTEHLSYHCKCKIIGIDKWEASDDYHDIYTQEDLDAAREYAFSRVPLHQGRIKLIQTSSRPPHFDSKPKLVYIDANHSEKETYLDMEYWWERLPSGGILSGHDYMDDHRDHSFIRCADAVDAFAQEHRLDLHITDRDGGFESWFILKP